MHTFYINSTVRQKKNRSAKKKYRSIFDPSDFCINSNLFLKDFIASKEIRYLCNSRLQQTDGPTTVFTLWISNSKNWKPRYIFLLKPIFMFVMVLKCTKIHPIWIAHLNYVMLYVTLAFKLMSSPFCVGGKHYVNACQPDY